MLLKVLIEWLAQKKGEGADAHARNSRGGGGAGDGSDCSEVSALSPPPLPGTSHTLSLPAVSSLCLLTLSQAAAEATASKKTAEAAGALAFAEEEETTGGGVSTAHQPQHSADSDRSAAQVCGWVCLSSSPSSSPSRSLLSVSLPQV